MTRLLFTILLISVLFVSGCTQLSSDKVRQDGGTQIGEKLLDLELGDFRGEKVKFSDFKGKALLINSWAAWCPFCIDEMPDLQKVSNEHDDLTVLFVHRTPGDPFVDAQKLLDDIKEKKGIEITDPLLKDKTDEFYKRFFGFGMPVTLFVDKDGVIRDKKIGAMQLEEIRERSRKILLVQEGVSDKSQIIGTEDRVKVLDKDTTYPKIGLSLPKGTKYTVDPAKLIGGGPPKGGIGVDIGIPALVNPKFIPASEASYLQDNNLVLAVSRNGVSKAYPFAILNWHEIANDDIAGLPIVVSFCPLCRSGVIFERTISAETVNFGVSGKLYNSDVVMYDDKTDTYWSQVAGAGIIGPLAGEKLKAVPSDIVKWGDWKRFHPETLVLSKDTGFRRNYEAGDDIYGTGSPGFSGIGVDFADTRLESNKIVFGVNLNEKQKAYPAEEIEKVSLVQEEVGGVKILAVWDPELKTVKIFERKDLNFNLENNKIKDSSGKEYSVEDLGSELKRVDTFGHFWFAWLGFYPQTELYKA